MGLLVPFNVQIDDTHTLGTFKSTKTPLEIKGHQYKY